MSYSSPRTWATDDPITAAALNQDVRDNVAFLANPPRCIVYNNANISIPNNAATALTFNSERQDSDAMHSTSSNTSRITCVTAGLYDLFGCIRWASQGTVTGVREVGIRLNGATYLAVNDGGSTLYNGLTIIQQVTRNGYPLSVGDYVELVPFQSSGGALNVEFVGNYSPEFAAIWRGF